MSWVETAKVAVEEIRKKRETTEAVHEAEELIRDCEKSEIGEIRSGHMDGSTRLYRDRGWVQIFSGYLNKSIYLVKDETVKVPDPTILKYTQQEVESLRDLNIDEIKTLCSAKEIFFGVITNKGTPWDRATAGTWRAKIN